MTTASISIEIVLDRCLRAIREEGYSIDDCLAHYPKHQEALEPLLLLVIRLQSARTLEAPQDFRNIALTRMINLIESQARPSKRRARARLASIEKASNVSAVSLKKRFSFKSVALVLIAFLVILIVAGAGVAYAASNALPGSFFYPIKNTVELMRLAVSYDEYRNATLYLNYSQQRLEEAEVLMRQQQLGEAKFSLIDYQVEAHFTLEDLADGSRLTDEQRVQLARLTIERYSHNEAFLQALLTQAPEILRPSVETALELTKQVLERAKQLVN